MHIANTAFRFGIFRSTKISSIWSKRKTSSLADPLIKLKRLTWQVLASHSQLNVQYKVWGSSLDKTVTLSRMHATLSMNLNREWVAFHISKATCSLIIQIRICRAKPWSHCRNCARLIRCKEVQVVILCPAPTDLFTLESPITTVQSVRWTWTSLMCFSTRMSRV